MDLAIVFDGSDSVKADNFKKLKARGQKKKETEDELAGLRLFKVQNQVSCISGKIKDNFWTKFSPKNCKLFSFWCFLTQILI